MLYPDDIELSRLQRLVLGLRKILRLLLLPVAKLIVLPVDCVLCAIDVLLVNLRTRNGRSCPCLEMGVCIPAQKYANKWLFRLFVCPHYLSVAEGGEAVSVENFHPRPLRALLFLCVFSALLSGFAVLVVYSWPEMVPEEVSPEEIAQQAAEKMAEGEAAFAQGNYQEALEHYQAVLVLTPTNRQSAYRAAQCLTELDDDTSWHYYRWATFGDDGIKEAARLVANYEYEKGNLWEAGIFAGRAIQLGLEDGESEAMVAEADIIAGLVGGARRHLERADELTPDSPKIPPARARLLLLAGQPQQAAAVLDSDDPAVSQSYSWRLARVEIFMNTGEFETGLNELEALAADFPEVKGLPVAHVDMLLKAGRQEEAIAKARELETDISLPPAEKLKLAQVLQRRGKLDFALCLALELAEPELVSKAPDRIALALEQMQRDKVARAANLMAAKLYLGWQMFEPALRHANRMLDADPTNMDAMMIAGKVSLARNHTGAAMTCFETVLASQPEHAEALFLLGKTNWSTSHRTRGMEQMKRACELAPESGLYHLEYGHALLAAGKIPEAKQAYQVAARFLPNPSPAFTRLGLIAQNEGDLDEAQALYRKAVDADPKQAFIASNFLAQILLQQKTDLPMALALAHVGFAHCPPQFKGSLADTYAQVCIELGKPATAVGAARLAAKANPDSPERLLRLGIAENAAGNTEQALAALRKVKVKGAGEIIAVRAGELISEIEATAGTGEE